MLQIKPPLIFLKIFLILSVFFFLEFVFNHFTKSPTKSFPISTVTKEKNIKTIIVSVVTPTSADSNNNKTTVYSQSKTWGVAQKIDEHSWTIKVTEDNKIGTAKEIFTALNYYRQNHGKRILMWDEQLTTYAQSRSDWFLSSGTLDAHAGFNEFTKNQDGFNKLGFMSLGENSSLGYKLEAVHLIEWVFAGDAPHNDNQLDNKWTDVGIGVSGQAVDIIFGGSRM